MKMNNDDMELGNGGKEMAANVETMFYTRQTPWHGLGKKVDEAPDSRSALILAGLDWNVRQRKLITDDNIPVEGYLANVRDIDDKILGVVTDRYKVVQNREAFSFTDSLLGEGVKYETAGSLQGGKKVWILARLPQKYIMSGDEIEPYLVFSNSHDGSGSIRVAVTPVRVVCQNTLNLALSKAKRTWATVHTGNVQGKLEDARNTLFYAGQYMTELGKEFDNLRRIKLADAKAEEMVKDLLPIDASMPDITRKNIRRQQEDILIRYHKAPDLLDIGRNGYRFINAVADFATHADPIRRAGNYRESLFAKTVDGNPITDKAFQMVKAA